MSAVETRRSVVLTMVRSSRMLLALALLVTPSLAGAQSTRAGGAKPGAGKAAGAKSGGAGLAALQGSWNGTATVQLGDSAITVPVLYAFTTTNGATTGTATVPGQGSGPISNVLREGTRIRFRVTAPEGRLLEHDGQMSAEQVIEGMVFMDQKPLAKFRITPAKTPPAGAAGTPRSTRGSTR
jgi:type IV secretory pathway TrbL component